MSNPFVLEETADFAVVFKPPKMHTSAKNFTRNFTTNRQNLTTREWSGVPARTKEGEQNTLVNWYMEHHDNVKSLFLMHRLDYETHGLVLFAKSEKSFNFFKDLQDKGGFIKEYSAICMQAIDDPIDGFPPCPLSCESKVRCAAVKNELELVIESYFRPYGPGRKLVRPVIEDGKKHKEIAKDKGGFYRTEVININDNVFTLQIKRGFRHQIRCHLCWIGFSIINDPLYSHEKINPCECSPEQRILALRSHALFFTDPSGNPKEYAIKPLNSSCSMQPQQLQKDLLVLQEK
jgi:23S rRNA pseudouridine1911/1915/1917 synthase